MMSAAEESSPDEDNLTNHVIDWSITGDDSSQSDKLPDDDSTQIGETSANKDANEAKENEKANIRSGQLIKNLSEHKEMDSESVDTLDHDKEMSSHVQAGSGTSANVNEPKEDPPKGETTVSDNEISSTEEGDNVDSSKSKQLEEVTADEGQINPNCEKETPIAAVGDSKSPSGNEETGEVNAASTEQIIKELDFLNNLASSSSMSNTARENVPISDSTSKVHLDTAKISTNLQKMREKIKQMRSQNSSDGDQSPMQTQSKQPSEELEKSDMVSDGGWSPIHNDHISEELMRRDLESGVVVKSTGDANDSTDDIVCAIDSVLDKEDKLVSSILEAPTNQKESCPENMESTDGKKIVEESSGVAATENNDIQDDEGSLTIDLTGANGDKPDDSTMSEEVIDLENVHGNPNTLKSGEGDDVTDESGLEKTDTTADAAEGAEMAKGVHTPSPSSDHSNSTAPYEEDVNQSASATTSPAPVIQSAFSLAKPPSTTAAITTPSNITASPTVHTSMFTYGVNQPTSPFMGGPTKTVAYRSILPKGGVPIPPSDGVIRCPPTTPRTSNFMQQLGLVTKGVIAPNKPDLQSPPPLININQTASPFILNAPTQVTLLGQPAVAPAPTTPKQSTTIRLKPTLPATETVKQHNLTTEKQNSERMPTNSPKTPEGTFRTPTAPRSSQMSPIGHSWKSSPCKGFFICAFPNCEYSSNDANEFRQHNSKSHPHGKYPCVYCHQQYPDSDALTQHMKQHSTKKQFQTYRCTACRFSTNLKDVFKHHWETVHKDKTECPCPHCKESHENVDELLQHIQKNILKLIECPYCHVKSPVRSKLLGHISQAHPGQPRKISVSTSVMCQHKGSGETSIDGLMLSPGSTIASPPHSSQMAPKSSIQSSTSTGDYLASLKAKKNKLRQESYQCVYCSHTVAEFGGFVQHVHKHSSRNLVVKYFCCPYCPCVTTRKSALMRHIPAKHHNVEQKAILREFPLDDTSYPCWYCVDYKAPSPGLLHLHYISCLTRLRMKKDYETYQDLRQDDKSSQQVSSKVSSSSSSTLAAARLTFSTSESGKPVELNVPVYEPTNCMRFFCMFCKMGYFKLVGLEKHIRNTHLSTHRSMCDFPLSVCSLCHFQSTDPSIVSSHCHQKHWRRATINVVESRTHRVHLHSEPSQLPVTIDRYHCDYCNFSTNGMTPYTEHMRLVHDIENSSAMSSAGSASQDSSENSRDGSPAIMVQDEQSGQVVNLPNQNTFKSTMNCPQCHNFPTLTRRDLIHHLKTCQQQSSSSRFPSYSQAKPYLPFPKPTQSQRPVQPIPDTSPIDLTVSDSSEENGNVRGSRDLGNPLDLSVTTSSALDLSVKNASSLVSPSAECKSFKCGYCAFESDQKYYIQIHCSYEHGELPEKIDCKVSESAPPAALPIEVAPATSTVSPAPQQDSTLSLELAAVTSLAVDGGSDNMSTRSDNLPGTDGNSTMSEHTASSEFSHPSTLSEKDKIKQGLMKLKAKVASAKERESHDTVDLSLVKSEPVDEVDDDLAMGSEASDVAFQASKYRYQCAHCQYETKYSTEMEKHILRVHLGQMPYLCSRCGFGSFVKNKLKQHFRYKHRGVQVSMVDVRSSRVVEVKRENGVVLMKAKNEQNILQSTHPYHKHHEENTEIPSTSQSEGTEMGADKPKDVPKGKGKKKTYKCHHCGHSSLYCINDIKKHVIRKHLGTPVYMCPRCEFGADKRVILTKHLSRVHTLHNLGDSDILDNKEKLVTRTIEMEDEMLYIVKSKEHVTVLASDLPSSTPAEADASQDPDIVTRQEYACGHCNYQCSLGTNDISRHIIEHHLPVAMFRCQLCSFQCEEEPTIIDHVDEAHEGTPNSYEDTKSRLITKRHVLGEVATYITKIEDKSEKLPTPTKKVVYCAHCNYCSPYSITLKRHMISQHFPGKLFKCNQCDLEVNDRNRIERHMIKNHPDTATDFIDGNLRLLMDVVTRGTKKVTQMRVADISAPDPVPPKPLVRQSPAPVPLDSGNGPRYICGICGKTERNKLGLMKRHVVTFHLKTSPFTCDVCSYSSNSQGNMLDHMSVTHPTTLTKFTGHLDSIKVSKRLDSGRLVYTCYTEEGDLDNSHFVMPGKCKLTLTPFEDRDAIDPATLSGLKRIYTCGACDYQSTACLTDVKRHACKTHLNLSTYACNTCKYGSNKKQDIVTHIIGKHSGRGDEFIYVPAEKLCSTKKVEDGKLVYTVVIKGEGEEEVQENDSVVSKADSGISSECFTPPRQYKPVERKSSNGKPTTKISMIYCGHCEWHNKYIGDVKRHVISQHLKKMEFMCNLCETYMDAKHKLANHIRFAHPGVADASREIIDNKRELSVAYKTWFSVVYITALESEMKQFPDDMEVPIDAEPSTSQAAKTPVSRRDSVGSSGSGGLFSCGHCDYKNNSNARDVTKHILRSHTDNKNLYDCMECEFGCQVKDQMVAHFASSHPGIDNDLYCDNSMRCVETSTTMDGQDMVVVRLREGEICLTQENKNKYRCAYCSYSSRFPRDVEKHVVNLHTNSLRCIYCSYKGRVKEDLRLHCIDKHPELPADMKTYDAPTVRIPDKSFDGCFIVKTAKSADALLPSQSEPEHVPSLETEHESPPATVSKPPDEGSDDLVSAYRCETCGYTRLSRNEVRVHVFMVHLHYRPYKCAHCPYTAPQNTRINLHIRNMHPNKTFRSVLMRNKSLEMKAEGFFKQVVVPQSKITNLNVRYNIEIADKTETSSGIHKCKYCDYKTTLIGYLRKHAKIHYTFRPFKCGYCEYGEFSQAKIFNHMKCHHSDKPAKVRSFPKPPQSELVLKTSFNTPPIPRAKPAVTISPRSNREIRRPSRYLSPDPEDIPNDKYNCKMCGDSFTRINDMENHVMGHINYKPFSCVHCSYVAISGNKIMDHTQAEHEGEKVTYRYERDDAFDKKMTELIEYPTLKRRFSSTDFNAATSVQKAPKKARRDARPTEEGGLYHCPYCSLVMDGIVTVKRHMMKHHNYKPFQCPLCDFAYYLTSAVKKHYTERHNKFPKIQVIIDPDLDFKCMSDVFNICGGSLGKGNRLLSYQDPCVQPDVSCSPVYTPDMFTQGLSLKTTTEIPAQALKKMEQKPTVEVKKELVTKEELVTVKTEVEDVGVDADAAAAAAEAVQEELFPESTEDEMNEVMTEEGETMDKGEVDFPTHDQFNDAAAEASPAEETESLVKKAPLVSKTPKVHTWTENKSSFHCPLCDFICPRVRAMRYHLMTHKKYQPFCCPFCPKRGAFDLGIAKHISLTHPKVKSNKCIVRRVPSIEKWISKQLQNMVQRSKTMLAGEKQLKEDPGSESFLMKCFYCQYVTHNEKALKLHFVKSHPAKKVRKVNVSNPLLVQEKEEIASQSFEVVAPKADTMLKCKYCNYCNTSIKNVKIHNSKAHHNKPFATVPIGEEPIEKTLKRERPDEGANVEEKEQSAKVPRLDGPFPPDGQTGYEVINPKILRCGRCQFVAINMMSLKVHNRRVHGNVTHLIAGTSADEQPKATTSNVKKVKAFMKGSKRMYRCTMCSFTRHDPKPVSRHFARCHEYCNQKVMCGHCGHTAHESYDIKLHTVRQHPDKPTKVVRLTKPLPRPDGRSTADGDSNEPSEASSRETSQEKSDETPDLSSRESSTDKSIPDIKQEVFETLETPIEDSAPMEGEDSTLLPSLFNCDRCDFIGESEDELTHHIMSHVDQTFTCELCDFTSEVKGDYIRHVKTHTEQPPFQCGHCSFTGFSRHAVKQHCRKRHPDDESSVVELPHPFTSVGKSQPTMQPKVKMPKRVQDGSIA